MKVSNWSFEITDDCAANRAMKHSQSVHVIANIRIWIFIELLMALKGVSDFMGRVGGVNETFVFTRVAALMYWLAGYYVLRRVPHFCTKALLLYHLLLSASMIVLSNELCGVKNGPLIAYEMITRSYLLLYIVIMILLNSNYKFTQYYIPVATTLTTYLTVGPHYGFSSRETLAKTSDIFYFMIIFMVSNYRQFCRSVELFITNIALKREQE